MSDLIGNVFISNIVLNKSVFEKLPLDIIQYIALKLDYNDIINKCKSSKIFNQAICQNEDFWYLKTIQDHPNQQKIGTWKKTYKITLQKLYTFGDCEYGRHGNLKDQSIPKLVEILTNVTCGRHHTAVISNGKLLSNH